MNTTHTPVRLVLTDEQLTEITTAARESWISAVVLTFRAFGVDLGSPDCAKVRCCDYAIPTDQWKAIAEACGADLPSDVPGLRQVNHMLDWMNYGPSSFEPERPGDRDPEGPDDDGLVILISEGPTAHARDCRCSNCFHPSIGGVR